VIENAMAQYSNQSIPKDKFLLMSMNLLHRAFIESARTDAKNLFRGIAEGGSAHLATVQMEDKSTVRFQLSLDHSEFVGRLNYGAFRASVAVLINNIAQALEQEREVALFNPAEQSDSMIFGITAVTMEDDKPSVMVLGADMGGQDAAVQLRLMYLDHQQFARQQDTAAAVPGRTEPGENQA
jgi:hypothetical protein